MYHAGEHGVCIYIGTKQPTAAGMRPWTRMFPSLPYGCVERTYEVHTGQDGSYGCRADPARRGGEMLCRFPAMKSEAWLKGCLA